MGTELLTSLHQNIATHISDHIHEWKQWRRLTKVPIHDRIFANWFTKSLFPPITKYVSMFGVITKEKVIHHDQQLDLIYSQSGTLYDLIPHAPQTSNYPPHPTPGHHVDVMVGLVSSTIVGPLTGKLIQLNITSNPTSFVPKTNSNQTPT